MAGLPNRPLSPHLFIYRPMATMVASILHRMTGVICYFGMIFLVWYLLAASIDVTAFNTASGFLRSWFGGLIVFGYLWALMNHLLGGIRHLLAEFGWGLDHPEREWTAKINLLGGLFLAILLWLAYVFFG